MYLEANLSFKYSKQNSESFFDSFKDSNYKL